MPVYALLKNLARKQLYSVYSKLCYLIKIQSIAFFYQTIIETNTGLFSIETIGTNIIEMWTKNATFLQANNFEDMICKPGPVCAKTTNAKFMLRGQFDGIRQKNFDDGEYSRRRGCSGRLCWIWARWICVCLQEERTFIECPGKICNSCSYCYNNAITSMQYFLREEQWTLTC